MKYVEQTCGLNRRTAARYVSIAKHWDQIGHASNLSQALDTIMRFGLSPWSMEDFVELKPEELKPTRVLATGKPLDSTTIRQFGNDFLARLEDSEPTELPRPSLPEALLDRTRTKTLKPTPPAEPKPVRASTKASQAAIAEFLKTAIRSEERLAAAALITLARLRRMKPTDFRVVPEAHDAVSTVDWRQQNNIGVTVRHHDRDAHSRNVQALRALDFEAIAAEFAGTDVSWITAKETTA